MKTTIFKYFLIALFSFGVLSGCNMLDSMGPNDPPKEDKSGPGNNEGQN
jgi:hypothetical protein